MLSYDDKNEIVIVFSDYAKGGVLFIGNNVHFVHKIIILGNMFKKENKKMAEGLNECSDMIKRARGILSKMGEK